jgi:hypothetical protein
MEEYMKSSAFVVMFMGVVSVIFAGTLTISSTAIARTLTVVGIIVDKVGDNATTFNGTKYITEGTDEEITSRYYELGTEFDKQSGIQPGDPVTFVFGNNSNVTIPYTGEYKNPGADAVLDEVFHPLGEPEDRICWFTVRQGGVIILQTHYVC